MSGLKKINAVWVMTKKIFSLTLILNALITVATVSGILYGFYHAWPWWKPYAPYLVSGNFFLIAAAAALINIFPSASIGRALHTGRLWFHHYVYGFFVLLMSSVYVLAFTSVSLITLFLVNTGSMEVNTGRFFVLTGLTLVLDDLPDVSKKVESTLNKLKSQAYRARKVFHFLQFVTGAFTFYIFLAAAIFMILHPSSNIANFVTLGTLLVTSITSFACVKRKSWVKITNPETISH
ncbi:MAG TPA: hypothetical protein VK536_06860 [Candidatus Limnocylindrales bacterium]|nr:hypothetical protein [Candidatus Limnocylindrales bacterium]